jgi:hypothetical protein
MPTAFGQHMRALISAQRNQYGREKSVSLDSLYVRTTRD